VVLRSKVWVCCRSLAGIAGANCSGVGCCQVEVSATSRSLVQRSPTECGVSECDLETSTIRMPRLTRAVEPWKKAVRILCTFRWFSKINELVSVKFQNISIAISFLCGKLYIFSQN
jgi:hypothetical protein